MNKILTIALSVLVFSCSQPEPIKPAIQLSRQQAYIDSLAYQYKLESKNAVSLLSGREVKNKYQQLLHSYLVQNAVLDSFKVQPMDLSSDFGNTLSLKMEDNTAVFEFQKRYDSERAMFSDSVYQRLKGISMYMDTTVKFFYLGECSIGEGSKPFRISVAPLK